MRKYLNRTNTIALLLSIALGGVVIARQAVEFQFRDLILICLGGLLAALVFSRSRPLGVLASAILVGLVVGDAMVEPEMVVVLGLLLLTAVSARAISKKFSGASAGAKGGRSKPPPEGAKSGW